MPMKGKDKHIARLKKLSGPEVTKIATKVLYVGADMIRAHAHRSISAGAISGKNHMPSRPGEPPNRDTGHLQSLIETTMPSPTEARVTSSAEYSDALERGTSRIAARPFMRPARDAQEPKIQKLFNQDIRNLVKRSGT